MTKPTSPTIMAVRELMRGVDGPVHIDDVVRYVVLRGVFPDGRAWANYAKEQPKTVKRKGFNAHILPPVDHPVMHRARVLWLRSRLNSKPDLRVGPRPELGKSGTWVERNNSYVPYLKVRSCARCGCEVTTATGVTKTVSFHFYSKANNGHRHFGTLPAESYCFPCAKREIEYYGGKITSDEDRKKGVEIHRKGRERIAKEAASDA